MLWKLHYEGATSVSGSFQSLFSWKMLWKTCNGLFSYIWEQVSILVFVEDALEVPQQWPTQMPHSVSILVFVEDALEVMRWLMAMLYSQVSILVFVEDALEVSFINGSNVFL